ncbi:MAG: ABC transporter ATP-binding protein [Anaerolineaceae bacterium]|nr:ABC transporter ATP-binding protein [Anaerolineaceae bacterium]
MLAVDHLSLDIRQGELFSLLGVNGAGKTTTIKMLSCVLSPTSGDALLLGDSIVKAPMAVKAKINISPQETAVAPNLSVRENLEMIAGIYGHKKAAAREKAEEMIAEFSLQAEAHKRSKTLSGGMQRRLSIAMALISDPKILFLDEPTLGLDVLARRELWKVIEMLKEKTTMILTTHYMEEAEALSDRIGVLVRGQMKAVGTAEELIAETKSNSFEDAFVALAAGVEG